MPTDLDEYSYLTGPAPTCYSRKRAGGPSPQIVWHGKDCLSYPAGAAKM